jgi:ribose transport system substrate-binding protein
MSSCNRRSFLKATGTMGLAVGVAGCTGGIGGGTDTTFEQVGFTGFVRGGAWITAYIEAMEFYAEDIGVELDVRPNQQSSQKQVQDIRDFTNQGFDAIIAGIWSTGAAESAIDEAMESGVPVFTSNADTSSSEIPMYTGFSNTDGGAASAREMVSALEEQKPDRDQWDVLNVRGIQGNQSANQRSQGFLDVMEGEDRVNVVDTINGEYARDVAQSTTQEWINANEEPDGIYSGNLSMGLGVVQSLRNLDLLVPKGEEGHIVLTQMDGSPEVNPLVGEGIIDAAVDQPNYFYNPIAMFFAKQFVEAGQDPSVIPEVGTEVSPDQVGIEPAMHKGVELWSESIWAPGEMRELNGHPWFRTNSIVITDENFDEPFLWGNVWG